MEGVTKSFDGFRALDRARITVMPGEVHALLGENGAGKSTLMNVAAGLYAPDAGRVVIGGRTARSDGPLEARRLGLGMVHQHFKVVQSFTGLENIVLFNPRGGHRDALASVARDVGALADELGFTVDLARPAGELSIAERQRVEILKVLVAGARVIVLDEPTAVLTDREADALLAAVRRLAERGASIVLVTHKLRDALTACDAITVMRGGRTVATVQPGEVDEAELTGLIVGTDVPRARPAPREPGPVVLRLEGVTVAGAGGAGLAGVDLALRAGRIYGVAGVGGNGQDALAGVIAGTTRPGAGRVAFGPDEAAADVAGDDPARRRARGLAYIPVDRHRDAIAGPLSVVDNHAIGAVLRGECGPWWRVDRRRARAGAAEAIEAHDIQGVRRPEQRASLLSGGNAQKLVLAREFGGSPFIVLAHSPTRGLDVRAAAAVQARLVAARDAGAAVILISEDLDEVLELSDRIGVLSRGRLTAEFDAPADRAAIGRAMVDHA